MGSGRVVKPMRTNVFDADKWPFELIPLCSFRFESIGFSEQEDKKALRTQSDARDVLVGIERRERKA